MNAAPKRSAKLGRCAHGWRGRSHPSAPLLLAACASATAGGAPAGLQIAAADGVEGCRYVTDVHGVSGAYGVFAGAGLEAARSEAMKAALAAGADTLVWRSTSTTYGQTSIHGDAYACPG